MSRFLTIILMCLPAASGGAADEPGVQRPNIVWIMSEDNSKHYLRHFDRHGAPAPNIEAMAQHGITFDRAFSCAPVCSVARTTLITCCYGPRIGTQFHRRSKLATLPKGLKMFPAYLRAAGYYTTNNSKEDYNAIKSKDVWDESSRRASWKNRPDESTPFFHVQTSTLSHESSLHFDGTVMDQPTATQVESVQLQPYFPDTPTFRYTRARYHDRIMAIDEVVGKVIGELKDAGQLENTFVFYFGDHGGVLPRSKGYAYESGLHIPLVVRVPERWQELTGRQLASRTNGFVEFVDFGPTVLQLAGLDCPAGIDGSAFLGPGVEPSEVDARNETFGYADRFDEKYDLVRTLRVGKFKYIRNFEPFLPDALQNNYRYKMLAYQQWRRLYAEGKLNAVEQQFFQPKSAEALYDLERDPHEVRNLADDPQYASTLADLRQRLNGRLKEMPDLSFLPEAVLYDQAMGDPVQFGKENQQLIEKLIDVANLALQPFAEVEPQLKAALDDENPWVRYWALVACTSFGDQAESLVPQVEKRLSDLEPLVVMRAVEFMAVATDSDPRPFLYRSFQRATNEPEALRMFNTATFLNDFFGDRLPIDPAQIQLIIRPDRKSQLLRRMEYLSNQQ
ncbi:MAG: sulfatase-like hydrolase/transferase [Pirellulales bacterium]|nr:sulfatase-like hydrolase/transferase [Pirellulales bacterium]